MEIISEEGLPNLVMVKIAKRIGVTDAALYKHFSSKNDMLLFMIEELEQSMITELAEHIGNTQGPIERIHSLFRFQLDFIEKNKGIPRIIFSESLQKQNPAIKAKIAGILGNYLEILKGLLEAAKAEGLIKEEIDVDAAAAIFIGMVQSSVIFWTLSNFSYLLKDRQAPLWQEYRKIIR